METSTSILEERVPPFRMLTRGEQVMLAVAIAAGEMGSRVEAVLRAREPVLSQARYNALRILRGAGASGLSCSDIADRLLLGPSDVTRLVDPLVRGGFVTRRPSPADRRVVLQRLTPRGAELLSVLAEDLSQVYDAFAEGLGPEGVDRLVDGCGRAMTVSRAIADPARDTGALAGATR